MKILLLEDEYMLSQAIRSYLQNIGHFVDYFEDGEQVLEAMKTMKHDLYILDINAPLVNGLECLKKLEDIYPDVPKIIISAYHDIEHISAAYSLGCSDYLKKPFNLKELEIKIQKLAKLQVVALNTPIVYLSQQYSFNTETNLLYFKQDIQKFSKREYALIKLFVNNINEVVSEQNIRLHVWEATKNDEVQDSTVRSLVNRVRKKLKEDLIENIHGYGYILRKAKN